MAGNCLKIAAAAVAVALAASTLAGCDSPPPMGYYGLPPLPMGYYGSVFNEAHVPGAPRTPLEIYRRLLEDGYEIFSPPDQQGAVYFVGVIGRRGRPACMIVEAFTGTILQTYFYGPDGNLIARNRNTPGPGFPGAPPFRDGRHSGFCPPPPGAAPRGAESGAPPQGLQARY